MRTLCVLLRIVVLLLICLCPAMTYGGEHRKLVQPAPAAVTADVADLKARTDKVDAYIDVQAAKAAYADAVAEYLMAVDAKAAKAVTDAAKTKVDATKAARDTAKTAEAQAKSDKDAKKPK